MKKSHKPKKRRMPKARKKTKRVNSSFNKMSIDIKQQNENEKVKLIGPEKMKKGENSLLSFRALCTLCYANFFSIYVN